MVAGIAVNGMGRIGTADTDCQRGKREFAAINQEPPSPFLQPGALLTGTLSIVRTRQVPDCEARRRSPEPSSLRSSKPRDGYGAAIID
jgi:hypothetical protein